MLWQIFKIHALRAAVIQRNYNTLTEYNAHEPIYNTNFQ